MAIGLSVCVLTYQGGTLLPDCLTALTTASWPLGTHELLILDNGSHPPATYTLPPNFRIPVRLVHLERNTGSNIGGMNACFQHAQGAWILFLANDVRVLPACLQELWKARALRRIVQPVLYQPSGAIDNYGLQWLWPGYGRRLRSPLAHQGWHPVPAFTATCFLMARSLWQELGGFDERLGISHEDIDFSLRARRRGGRIYAIPAAGALHLMGQTIGRVVVGPLTPYYRRARQQVIQHHYRGLDRWLRRRACQLIEGGIECIERRRASESDSRHGLHGVLG